ncbi:MAG: glycosyltransferase [Clostridia bacterium]|nr:glycosyltransferase [Clostridia bacterium]
MKILHFACYYSPHIGGIEQVAQDVVSAIGNEYEQRVICFNHKKHNETDIVDGIKVVRAGCFAKIASQQISFSFKKLLKRQFKEFKPDLLIFHYPNPFAAHYILKMLKKFKNCKLILYWHLDITKQKLLGKLFNGQTQKLLKRAEKVVATSPNYIEGSKFLPDFINKCVVVPNCVNSSRLNIMPEDVQKAEQIKHKNCGKIICFAIGRHVPYKGMEYLIRASKLLSGDFKIIIGGEGPLTESLKSLSEGDEKVEFIGKVNNSALRAYMLACDIFCFPSITKNEAFGIALAEAMSYSKPSVTFTIEGSGVNYVSVGGETGIEVENCNVEKYARAIEMLASDSVLRDNYGAEAKKRVELLFTDKKFKNNIKNLINGIL